MVAADLAVQAPPTAVVPDWGGFYVGIHGGGGWGHTSFESEFVSNSANLLNTAPPHANPTGGVFGGEAGYNWQWGPTVGGLEFDFSGADIDQMSPFSILTAPPASAGLISD